VCFHGPSAFAQGRQILYVTERAVFELRAEGLTLVEITEGIDPERDVLAHMGFRPAIATPLRIRTLRKP
jgi:propionate CoA-transferase